ncbi:hypothetical protein AQUCO_00400064v1 [Aquilegia coerulea]|uniref:Apyrase n=1 Tax=Aquilegia coerulea TaxID=218851 RepID=A0A2G5ET74_AQUCA|nr:hypothetical protein AQUCO_00400064v1 [Aquilegia coerulea]PIA58944.1 hypothetical protein AQUCO_00400064v1 [Aquilegia coerulea]
MAFTKIADIVSAATSRVTNPRAPPSGSSILPPSEGLDHGYGFAYPEQKNYMRSSSSLQDFSTYRGLDPEKDDFDLRAERSALSRSLDRENGGLSFSKEKLPQGNSIIRRKWFRAITCILGLVLAFSLIFFCVKYFSNHFSQEASRYYVVLDCGSTGTRVYVYESSIDHKKGGTLPIVLRSLPKGQGPSNSQGGRAYQRMETEPGFDKLVHNISGLRGAIGPLLQWAEEKIPKKAHKDTSLFLYATAGVRRLQQSHSKWLLKNAWSILRNSSFTCRREWVKTITGMEEAYFGWVALNYQMGMLGSLPAKPTFGALDLGGSSLQVTFETKELVQDETSLNLSIGAINHHLNAYSLSGYGLNDAFEKSVVHLLKKHPGITDANLINGKLQLKHPCLQTDYKEKYICSQCASLNQEVGSPLIGEGKKSKGAKSGIAIELLGAPQWQECIAVAKVAVNLSEWSKLSPGIDCEMQPCALSASLPRPRGQFFAMSGFFVVFRFFNLSSEATLDDVLQKGQEFCEKPWKIAKNSVSPQPFIEQYCFRAPYIVSLLREGLHITDGQVVIGSGSITWTLGVALLKAGGTSSARMDMHSYSILHLKMKPTVLFLSVFMSLVFLICAISCVSNWMPRFFRRPYLPLFRNSSATTTSVLNIPSPFTFQRWSPINSGDARIKMPLSPTIARSQHRPFSMGHGLGGSSIQLMESSLYPSSGNVSHSYSSGSLGQMRLQSRRSQSREDLNSSMADLAKV